MLTSTVLGHGVSEFRQMLAGKVSVLAGKSGVGKSSLVNAVFTGDLARTTAVSDWSSKGRHTTTSSRLYPIPGGGYLVDTPGIRELGLFEDDGEAVDSAFPEIEAAAGGCRFRDCTHTHEPHCAVKGALHRGEVAHDRYERYVRMRGRR